MTGLYLKMEHNRFPSTLINIENSQISYYLKRNNIYISNSVIK
jgi:hypothetical protein